MSFINDVIEFGFVSGAGFSETATDACAAPWTEIEALYVARREAIIRSLLRFGVEPLEAEDIMQEAFLRLYVQVLKHQRPDNSYQWLMFTARNISVDHHRKRRREEPGLAGFADGGSFEVRDESQDVESATARREHRALLWASLRELQGEQRMCLVGRIHGLTFREIAGVLNLPERTVIYQTSLAIESVKKRLKRAVPNAVRRTSSGG